MNDDGLITALKEGTDIVSVVAGDAFITKEIEITVTSNTSLTGSFEITRNSYNTGTSDSYSTYSWSSVDTNGITINGKGNIYAKETKVMQYNGSKTPLPYNETETSGAISQIEMTFKAGSSVRTWTPYLSSSSCLTSSSNGTALDSKSNSGSTTQETITWSVDTSKNYRYFYLQLSSNASFIEKIKVSYESGSSTPEATLNNITLDSKPTKLSGYFVGDTLDLSGVKVTGHYSDGTTKDVTSLCQISPTTLSTAGTQTITIQYLDKSLTFNVDVENMLVSSINISGSNTVNVGDTLQLTAEVLPTNATNNLVTWSVDNQTLATIDTTGKLTALKAGKVTVKAVANDISGVYDEFEVVINNVLVNQITIEGPSDLVLNASYTYTASISPNNATLKNITWSSENTDIISINSTSGLATALKVGTSKIYACSTDGSGIQGELTVSVSEAKYGQMYTIDFYDSASLTITSVSTSITLANIQNNIYEGNLKTDTSSNFTKITGSEVVTAITESSKVYYPKVGGVCLGSGSAAGTLSLTLNENYAAHKVTLYGASYESGYFSLNSEKADSGSLTSKSSDISTITNPLVWENLNGAQTLTISTSSKRLTIYRLVINYGPQLTADIWSQMFIDKLTCDSTGNTAPSINEWNHFAELYDTLTSSYKSEIKASIGDEFGDIKERAIAKYTYIISKYNTSSIETYVNFIDLNVTYKTTRLNSALPKNTDSYILVFSISTALVVSSFFFI